MYFTLKINIYICYNSFNKKAMSLLYEDICNNYKSYIKTPLRFQTSYFNIELVSLEELIAFNNCSVNILICSKNDNLPISFDKNSIIYIEEACPQWEKLLFKMKQPKTQLV